MIPKRLDNGPTPLSSPQERLFLLDQLMSGLPVYNVPTLMRVGATLDPNLLRAALNAIVSRHEILRTHIRLIDGVPVQEAAPFAEVELTVADLRARPKSERDGEGQNILGDLAGRSFDLANDVLLRAGLVHLDQDEDLLLIVLHHIASDHASSALLFAELEQLYASLRDGTEPSLPDLPIQYADFARWQREQLAGHRLDEQLEYWTQRLAGAPPRLELPADHPRPSVQSYRGASWEVVLAPHQVAPLRDLARGQRASLFMVVLAAFNALIHRYTGVDDVVLGTPVSGRQHDEIASLLGFFTNTLALRTDLSGDPTFAELLARVKLTTLDALAHQELPFEKLVEVLNPERSQSHAPIFQVLFGFAVTAGAPGLAGCTLEALPVPGWQWSRFDLSIVLHDREDGSLSANLEYSTDLFDAGTIERLAHRYVRLLEAAVADPQQSIDELPLLDADEREEAIAAGRHSGHEYRVQCMHEAFERRAAATPDACAVSFEGQSLTYGQLNVRANRLAHRLIALGAGPETLVALLLEPSLELVVAILGVLKAGAAYLPLDPGHPRERLDFVLADAGAKLIVTERRLLERLGDVDATAVCLDGEAAQLKTLSEANPVTAVGPENLAYVIYTSGSTGRPKGVQVEHRQVARLFSATDEWFGFTSQDVWMLLHSYAFDFSVWELWGALAHGGQLVVSPVWTTRSPQALAALVASRGVTVLNATPSLFSAVQDELLRHASELALRLVVFGGEALRPSALRPWFEHYGEGGPTLVNMYGITETTVHVTYRPLRAVDCEQQSSPIGVPIPDLSVYVLDAKGQPVPAGVAGELYVGGAGVARGYLNRPELTTERFVEDPFGPGRLYRTGDVAARLPDGQLEFRGRSDDQVKIRGFRIELGEIEAVLGANPAVAAAVVTVREDSPGDPRLVAYVVPADDHALDGEQLRRRLKSELPPFMVPSKFVKLEALPVTPNGKLDRGSLPAPDGARPDLERPYAAPKSHVEQTLASIWSEVLGIDRVGIDDDFFDLGGHSLVAVNMLARVHDSLGVSLPLRQLFDTATIRELAEALTVELLTGASDDDLAQILDEVQTA